MAIPLRYIATGEGNVMIKAMKKILFAIIMILLLLGSISFIARVIMKVMQGEGTTLYFTHWGYKVSYLGVFSLFFVIPVVLIIGHIIRYLYFKEEKDFLKKYGKRNNFHNHRLHTEPAKSAGPVRRTLD